jgi:predicted secreted protein
LKFIFPILSALAVLLVSTPGQTASETAVLLQKDNGRVVRATEGAIIKLSLEEQGGTGYIWDFNQLDENYFEVIKVETSSPAEKNAKVGGPVVKTWWLKVKKKGTSQISLDYFRPWEGRSKAAAHYQVKVDIQ